MKDLDEGFLKTRDFEAILDPTNQSYWVYLGTDVFKQSTNERYQNDDQYNKRVGVNSTYSVAFLHI